MYCTNCGTRVDSGNFCPQCGRPIVNRQAPAQVVTPPTGSSLPAGIDRDNKGVIRWTCPERDYTVHFYMDENRVGMRVVHKEREDTVGSAFKEMVKSGLELAANDIVMNSDAYSGQDLPWDSNEGGNSSYLTFSYIKKIKQNPKKFEILLKESISSMSLRMTAQQYPFILDYIIRHVPDAKIK